MSPTDWGLAWQGLLPRAHGPRLWLRLRYLWVLASAQYRVDRLTRSWAAALIFGTPCSMSTRASPTCDGVNARAQPRYFPAALAIRMPSACRSQIRLRSNSANAPSTSSSNRLSESLDSAVLDSAV